jgi:hypothetical protein
VPSALPKAVVLAVLIIWAARTGAVRRRPFWTSEPWRRFLAFCAGCAGSIIVALAMAGAVDLGIYRAVSQAILFRALWVGFMLAFLTVGTLGLVSALLWFVNGEPSRQFTLFRGRKPSSSESGRDAA